MATESIASDAWEDAVNALTFHRNRLPRPGETLLALLRAAHHLVNCKSEANLMQAILTDAAAVLNAQFAAVVLRDSQDRWQLSAVVGDSRKPPYFSEKLAERCFQSSKSVLCEKVEKNAGDGIMASVVCVLLSTPRRFIGVLWLDRDAWQRPFGKDDLELANALASIHGAGIECARLSQDVSSG